MSAWIVFPRHIDYMVEALQHYGGLARLRLRDIPVEEIPPDVLGQELMDANIDSVDFRYDDRTWETLPGPIDKSRMRPYHYEKSGLPLIPEAVAKAIRCFDYQTCEPGHYDKHGSANWQDWEWISDWVGTPLEVLLSEMLEVAIPLQVGPVGTRLVTQQWGDAPLPYYQTTSLYDEMPWGIDPDTVLLPEALDEGDTFLSLAEGVN